MKNIDLINEIKKFYNYKSNWNSFGASAFDEKQLDKVIELISEVDFYFLNFKCYACNEFDKNYINFETNYKNLKIEFDICLDENLEIDNSIIIIEENKRNYFAIQYYSNLQELVDLIIKIYT